MLYTRDGMEEPTCCGLCEVFEQYGGDLWAHSMLFETLWPTQGDEIARSHLARPLEALGALRQKPDEDIETPEDAEPLGVRLQWQRLIPETKAKKKEE